MTRTIYREKIPATDPRLKRHVLHDSESRRYAFNTAGLSIVSVEHHRWLPILDQGDVGSCTADAGFGVLGTDPYATSGASQPIMATFGAFTQAGAYQLYSAEEQYDGGGPWPPNDNGSSGLTLAKVLRDVGAIAGWTQTFTLDDALKALGQYPLAIGTVWFNSMFDPDPQGIITVSRSSGLAGGHEYEAVGYDQPRGLVHLANSWGTSWGESGYFWMAAEDLGLLLEDQGDVTVFTPLTNPAPVPTPVLVDANADDVALARVLDPWAEAPHVGQNHRAAMAYLQWRATKAL